MESVHAVLELILLMQPVSLVLPTVSLVHLIYAQNVKKAFILRDLAAEPVELTVLPVLLPPCVHNVSLIEV